MDLGILRACELFPEAQSHQYHIVYDIYKHKLLPWFVIIDYHSVMRREETTIGDEQFGCMPGRGTTDAIFAVRQLQARNQLLPQGGSFSTNIIGAFLQKTYYKH